MNNVQKQRLWWMLFIAAGTTLAVALSLFALRQNISAFYLPQQVFAEEIDPARDFRLGGRVVPGSIAYADTDLQVSFDLTDEKHTITVHYAGVLPDLFSENQGIIAQGRLNANGVFVASEVLAKHDEDYMPQAMRDAL